MCCRRKESLKIGNHWIEWKKTVHLVKYECKWAIWEFESTGNTKAILFFRFFVLTLSTEMKWSTGISPSPSFLIKPTHTHTHRHFEILFAIKRYQRKKRKEKQGINQHWIALRVAESSSEATAVTMAVLTKCLIICVLSFMPFAFNPHNDIASVCFVLFIWMLHRICSYYDFKSSDLYNSFDCYWARIALVFPLFRISRGKHSFRW